MLRFESLGFELFKRDLLKLRDHRFSFSPTKPKAIQVNFLHPVTDQTIIDLSDRYKQLRSKLELWQLKQQDLSSVEQSLVNRYTTIQGDISKADQNRLLYSLHKDHDRLNEIERSLDERYKALHSKLSMIERRRLLYSWRKSKETLDRLREHLLDFL